jgi:hypothetical protein
MCAESIYSCTLQARSEKEVEIIGTFSLLYTKSIVKFKFLKRTEQTRRHGRVSATPRAGEAFWAKLNAVEDR